MNKRIAVEPNLRQFGDYLKNQGYEVVSPENSDNVIAIVIDGLDNNVMNVQNISTKTPVIDASGYTPEQILSRIKELG